jgi:protease-4
VSESRNLDHAQVDAVAQGQVWSGQAALDKKLVDAFGSLQNAIDAAAKLASVANYQVDVRQPALSPMQKVLKQMMSNGEVQAVAHWLAVQLPQPSPVQAFLHHAEEELAMLIRSNDPQHVYARCLECSSLRL